MQINMLENGLDSLKRGFSSYLQYKKSTIDKAASHEDYFILKQAILNLQHGVEILLKYIVGQKSEFLIIENIDKNYRQAFVEKETQGLSTVFNTSHASNIRTITYEEALVRAKDLCGVALSNGVEEKLKKLNVYRNALTHAEIECEDQLIEELFDGILLDLDVLFLKTIGVEYEAFYGYTELKANYDQYMEFFDKEKLPVKRSVIEALAEAIEKTGLHNIGEGQITVHSDLSNVKVFLKEFQKSHDFGMDLYNGYCSGKAKIKVTDDGHISIWAYDNKEEYIFKFRSMLLFVPELKSNLSPMLVFESANDTVEEELEQYVIDDKLEGCCINDQVEYDPKYLNEFYSRCDYDDEFIIPPHYGVVRFLKQRIFGCFNIQGLRYWNFRKLLQIGEGKTGTEFRDILEKLIERS